MRVIDVMHLGRPHVIGCWEVDGALVDPGPESSVQTVIDALDGKQPEAVLLTHIHLDHAAATGALVRRWPELEVYVHERGAPHLIDPSKLLASAERLYGDQMQRLWGEIVPVPEANVKVLSGGETVRGMRVAYTPGHASHHVCYLHEESGTAFVGDVAACRIPPSGLIMPPTPPPDIDVEVWEQSLDLVSGWSPRRLALTHFGAVEDDVPAYLEAARSRLRQEAELVKEMDQDSYERDLQRRIREQMTSEGLGEETIAELLQAVPTAYQWRGLDRYWRKRAERAEREAA
ncbi:MAG TPA: MBL fold metallo-hydrolase [Solirubrobacterales bacterium]|jgi:glyoxylase-like metal-dependent hydrolase (beta-lactamase superfamily II)|nr:MBL fold metallo-hydrolase [Solirubrobacterales bacterium]